MAFPKHEAKVFVNNELKHTADIDNGISFLSSVLEAPEFDIQEEVALRDMCKTINELFEAKTIEVVKHDK